jgi:hypothetical protein
MPLGRCPVCRKVYLWEKDCRRPGRCRACREALEVLPREAVLALVRAGRKEREAV